MGHGAGHSERDNGTDTGTQAGIHYHTDGNAGAYKQKDSRSTEARQSQRIPSAHKQRAVRGRIHGRDTQHAFQRLVEKPPALLCQKREDQQGGTYRNSVRNADR